MIGMLLIFLALCFNRLQHVLTWAIVVGTVVGDTTLIETDTSTCSTLNPSAFYPHGFYHQHACEEYLLTSSLTTPANPSRDSHTYYSSAPGPRHLQISNSEQNHQSPCWHWSFRPFTNWKMPSIPHLPAPDIHTLPHKLSDIGKIMDASRVIKTRSSSLRSRRLDKENIPAQGNHTPKSQPL